VAAERSRKAKVAPRSKWVRRLKQALVLFSIVFVFAIVGGFAVYFPIYREAVENARTIESKLVVQSSNPSVIESAEGIVLFRISQVRRNVVDVNTLPRYVRYAMVAAEDRRFYDHRGVDVIGLLRSAFLAVRDRRATQGGSTIEMQLAKQLVNGDEHTFTRKLKDIATANQIENLKTKDQILNLYMNEAYFGEGAFGIDAASETYFRKQSKDLTLGEAALLARCVRSPSRQNPVKDLEGSIERRNYVLDVMKAESWITEPEYDAAVKEVPKLNPSPPTGTQWLRPGAGYFVDHVRQQFHQDFPGSELQTGGYKIVTTLNWKIQRAALDAVATTLRENRARKVNDAAFLLVDSDGRILAEVGGPGYTKSQFNVVTHPNRQPGSAFKPFVYATALKDGVVHLGDYVSNDPIHEVSDMGVRWDPKNNKGEPMGGEVPLVSAFAYSYNLPAIHTIQKVTPRAVIDLAQDAFGFRSHLPNFDSLAIGTGEVSPLEMAEGYSVFMLKGDRVRPFPIEKVVGQDGSIVKNYTPARFTGVLDPAVCQNIEDLLDAAVHYPGATGAAAAVVPDARGKTGTTQNALDAWFCGYSDGILGIAWVGNTDYKTGHARPMAGSVFGGNTSAKMWAEVLLAAHKYHVATPPPPKDLAGTSTVAKVEPAKATAPDPDEATPNNSDPDLDSPSNDGSSPNGTPNNASGAIQTSAPPYPQSVPPLRPVARAPQPTPKPPPPQQQPAPKPVARDDEADYVEVQVCADTGMRASIYCPETVTRRFRKGTEPKQVCRLHTGN
jgi:penicillin-binding protein 1A